FAAPRVAVLGVESLAAALDRSLPLLTARRRTAMPPHRTVQAVVALTCSLLLLPARRGTAMRRHRPMRAVVEWSYGLLSEDEQRFFRALGIFAGGFTVEAAAVVAIETTKEGADVFARLADLGGKSWVVPDVSGAKPRFRLLETIRAHALEKFA